MLLGKNHHKSSHVSTTYRAHGTQYTPKSSVHREDLDTDDGKDGKAWSSGEENDRPAGRLRKTNSFKIRFVLLTVNSPLIWG